MTPHPHLTRVRVTGFRSLQDIDLELGPVTVLIGPNGAGKSNLLSALTMAPMIASQSLGRFVSERGGATFLMHYGPKTTREVVLSLEFAGERGLNAYEARLGYGADESLFFIDERAAFRPSVDKPWNWYGMGSGHRESRLTEEAANHASPRTALYLLRRLNFYHFHDTSRNSALRTLARAEDDRYLRSDGSNLASYLLALRDATEEDSRAAWKRIQGLVQRIAPFIRELVPVTVGSRGVRLDWVDDRGETFGPAHLSDGTLRSIALFTALGQPDEKLPLLSCIDEPELGLHPAALSLLCAVIRSVASRRQVLVSTQSPVLLDELAKSPEAVVVAERQDGATTLRRLAAEPLAAWLEDYSLSELYGKNVLGGRP